MKDFQINEVLQSYKHIDFKDSLKASIELGNATSLIPVGNWILSEREILESLTTWRSANMSYFFSRFEATVKSTSDYLAKYSISESNRIMFLVMYESEILGHLGLSNVHGDYGEIDNVMKSPKWEDLNNAPSMRDCLNRLLEWSHSKLRVRHFGLKVLSSNTRAIKLYSNLGFSISKSLGVTEDPKSEWGSLVLTEDAEAAQSLQMLFMSLELKDPISPPLNL